MKDPLVSVIIPTYNGLGRGFLKEAVRSVLAQTYAHVELIIVDDGSTEDIAGGCGDLLQDSRVRLIRRDNGGLSAARMTGIQNTTGAYIALLDDDDRWAVAKLAKQLDFISKCPDPRIGMVFTGVRLIDADGHVIGARVKRAAGDIFRELVLHGNGITAPSAVLFKKDVIDTVGSFDPDMRSLEDLDLWLRIAESFHVYAMPELLTDYRLHADTITARDFSREEEYERKLYDKVLAAHPEFSRQVVVRNMLGRFALRHLSLGNYDQARIFAKESLAKGFSVRSFVIFSATFLPSGWLKVFKDFRRRCRLVFLR